MSMDQDIDDLLRQDEAELRAKRKRLKAFSTAVEDVRRSQETASTLAEELVNSGDLTRADLSRVFKLSRAERTLLVASRRSSASETKPDASGYSSTDVEDPKDGNENSKQDSTGSIDNQPESNHADTSREPAHSNN